MNFIWSLKPIFIWLTFCTGLDFDRSEKKKKIRRWFLRAYSLLLFICFVSLNIFLVAQNILELKCHLNSTKNCEDSIISLWNREISWILIFLMCAGFEFSVFVSAYIEWKPLWKQIKLVQLDLSDLTTSYRRLRRETFVGLLLLFTVIPSHSFNNILFLNKLHN